MAKEGGEEVEWAKKPGKSTQKCRLRSGEQVQSRGGVGYLDVVARSNVTAAERSKRTETQKNWRGLSASAPRRLFSFPTSHISLSLPWLVG